MIRRSSTHDTTGVVRTIQLVCDDCRATTPTIAIEPGSAATEDRLLEAETAIVGLRASTGFIEERPTWRGETAPEGIGDAPVHDLCARCAARRPR